MVRHPDGDREKAVEDPEEKIGYTSLEYGREVCTGSVNLTFINVPTRRKVMGFDEITNGLRVIAEEKRPRTEAWGSPTLGYREK